MGYHHLQKNREIHAVNSVFCPAAYRTKLRYESEEKALNAIKFGNGDIVRAYFCWACRCWHTTSKPDRQQPWEEMSEYIKNFYHIDTSQFEEVEEEKMVFVKVVENDELGKVILPGFFPVGVLAKRFGYVRQITTDTITRMTDIDAYVILENGKLVVKELKEKDKEGFLRSFAARLEEDIEATNTFTNEHEIFPKDLVFEYDVNKLSHSDEVMDTRELRQFVEERAVKKTVKDNLEPLDVSVISGDFSSDLAEKLMQNHLNFYLQQLELRGVDLGKNSYPLSSLAVRGKGLLTYAIAEYFPKLTILERILSNDSIQLALGRLGFYEFLEIDGHLAAVFFEAIYACAALQGKHDIRRKMEIVLVGERGVSAEQKGLVFRD
ncbi:hypothetical protein STRDD10_00792 [Streptococcus sp. DD10]|uniref:hypothetical protein n=1 Tax=Streptococcus sp. DD10 TaxID=1777878 RepID=UPI00079C109D|nr:hypothetical protein [Streptococcus sp. DD10]KXT74638.1 hypothetical protein STRDD10_00792 [Streptococcus sp. DD10]